MVGKEDHMTTIKTATLAAAAIAALASFSTASFAEGRGEGGRGGGAMMLQDLDADKNGSISKAEFEAGTLKRFTAGDADGNGNLTEAEFAAGAKLMAAERMKQREDARKARAEQRHGERSERRMARMFDALDADNDGAVAQVELAEHAAERFDSLDANNDGVIQASELPRRGGRDGR
jgi:Ca2+-binding EF-hand superfamily protein